ncbi:MAG TPA: hypothetical protein VGK34_10465 [Armatimonadota bacterium]|jgi:prepilin-type processing-associated H-X9-DG protein
MSWNGKWFSEARARRRHVEAYVAFIIMILVMTFTIGAYRNFIGAADQAACAHSLKRLMISLQMYSQDYDGHYPPKGTWVRAVLPYVDTLNVFMCPAGENLPRFRSRKNKHVSIDSYVSYWYTPPPTTENDATTIPVSGDIVYSNLVGNHDLGGNIVFQDCHVKWYTMDQWEKNRFTMLPVSARSK